MFCVRSHIKGVTEERRSDIARGDIHVNYVWVYYVLKVPSHKTQYHHHSGCMGTGLDGHSNALPINDAFRYLKSTEYLLKMACS